MDDIKLNSEFDKIAKYQAKIKAEFSYLESCDIKILQSEFIKAQAAEICRYIDRLSMTPFHSWNNFLKKIVEDETNDFLYQFYITQNEFGKYVPDLIRIQSLELYDPDPEEFPKSR